MRQWGYHFWILNWILRKVNAKRLDTESMENTNRAYLMHHLIHTSNSNSNNINRGSAMGMNIITELTTLLLLPLIVVTVEATLVLYLLQQCLLWEQQQCQQYQRYNFQYLLNR